MNIMEVNQPGLRRYVWFVWSMMCDPKKSKEEIKKVIPGKVFLKEVAIGVLFVRTWVTINRLGEPW